MKKVLFFTLSLFILFSCSSEEGDMEGDGSVNPSDPLIGVWNLNSIIGKDGTEFADKCDKMEETNFKSNGTLTSNLFELNTGTNNCDNSETINSNWKNNGNNTYTVGQGEWVISFSNNNKTLSFKDNDTTLTYSKKN